MVIIKLLCSLLKKFPCKNKANEENRKHAMSTYYIFLINLIEKYVQRYSVSKGDKRTISKETVRQTFPDAIPVIIITMVSIIIQWTQLW